MTGKATVAFDAAASVIVETTSGRNARSRLARLRNREPEPIPVGDVEDVTLHDVAVINGSAQFLYSTYIGDRKATKTDAQGYLYRQGVESSRRDRVMVAFAPEFGITHASYGGGVIVTSAVADLTENFAFVRPNGSRVKGLSDPTDDLEYNSPPYISDGVLSPDGRLLAYLEGPDTGMKSPERPVGPWVVVVLYLKTGREELRAQVAPNELCVSRLDFDGRWLVVSRAKPGRDQFGLRSCYVAHAEPLSIRVLDSRAARLELVELPNIVGVATVAAS